MKSIARMVAAGRITRLWSALCVALIAGLAAGQGVRQLDRAQYEGRLHGMWLAECIANWTGLRSEGKVTGPPFLTDADWGRDLGNGPLAFVLDQDPWLSDDDTDVEYITLALLHELGATELSGEELGAGWLAHMDDRFLWVSNRRALDLMRRGVVPPSTGLACANQYWLYIDAQLTTEICGALAPGMPREAFQIAEIPITNTARGHAAHATQTFMLLYSLVSQADPSLAPDEQIVWMVREARRYIPDTSKAADILDFVLADYTANPDKNDWERTRDLVYSRYQLNDQSNGFRYRNWTESSVNFACGLTALLYGRGDFLRTVQIGTLSGWDSDNGTATMGGLVGLMLGYDALVAQIREEFPAFAPSDRYDIERTRDNFPDYLPDDPAAQDTLAMMAARMLPIIERRIVEAGGLVDETGGLWLLPPPSAEDPVRLSPRQDLYLRSANNAVRRAGGVVTAWSSVASDPPQGYGSKTRGRFADGFEIEDSGRDVLNDGPRIPYSTLGAGQQPGDAVDLRVTYDRPVVADALMLIEGDCYLEGAYVGGWLDSPAVQVRINDVWVDPPSGFAQVPHPDPAAPFQMLVWTLAQPVEVTGVRVVGLVGGPAAFATVAEIDVLGPETIPQRTSFDIDLNGEVDVDDMYTWHAHPVDLDGDGRADSADQHYLRAAVRWREDEDMRFADGYP